MCEPVTIAATSAMVAGTGLSVYSQIRQGKTQEAMAQRNADLAEQQAADVTQRGAYEAADVMTEGRRKTNEARTVIAGSGVDANVGSVANQLSTSMANAAVDAARVKSNAARAAWGLKAEAQDRRTQGKIDKQAGYLGAIGTGLSGLGGAASAGAGTYKNFK